MVNCPRASVRLLAVPLLLVLAVVVEVEALAVELRQPRREDAVERVEAVAVLSTIPF
jgi:hypothetical protein